MMTTITKSQLETSDLAGLRALESSLLADQVREGYWWGAQQGGVFWRKLKKVRAAIAAAEKGE